MNVGKEIAVLKHMPATPKPAYKAVKRLAGLPHELRTSRFLLPTLFRRGGVLLSPPPLRLRHHHLPAATPVMRLRGNRADEKPLSDARPPNIESPAKAG
jgi:hypothetical protein